MKEKTIALFDLAGNEKYSKNVRSDEENIKVFDTFMDLWLAHFCISSNWGHKAYNTTISETFTESNEAMTMLLLKITHDNFKKCYDMQRVLTRKKARPKYTKVDSNSDKFHSWNIKGIRRYNALVVIVKRNRNSDVSKEMEM